jgi:hypothetical protein
MKNNLMLRSLAVLALYWIPASAESIVYSDYGVSFPDDSPGHYNIAFFAFAGIPFTTTGGGSLSSITFDVQTFEALPFTVGLYADSSGEPGTLLESWSVTAPSFVCCSPPPTTNITSALHPLLTSSTQYWFLIAGPNSLHWFANDQGLAGGIWVGDAFNTLRNIITDAPRTGIQVATTLPEPATISLLALGLLGMALVASRNRATGGNRDRPE